MSATLTPQDAIIYLMVLAAASDGDMRDEELRTIGRVVRSFPLFSDADEQNLVSTARAAGEFMAPEGGLAKVLEEASAALPKHLRETAYAAMVDVVTADEALDLTELRVLDMARDALEVSDEGASVIERAAQVRHATLAPPE